MKRILFVLLILSGIAHAQTTFNTKFKTGYSTDSVNARVTLPAGYPFNAHDSCQGIIFFCGLGEVGTDTTKMTVWGPHSYIAAGWNGSVVLGNGTHFPIIITIQEPSAYYRPFTYTRVIDSIMSKYKIFVRSLQVCGISMGGWTENSIAIYRPTTSDSSLSYIFKAIVNVEGVEPNDNFDATPPYPTGFYSVARNGGYSTGGYGMEFEQSNDGRDIADIAAAYNIARANSAMYIQTSFGDGSHGFFDEWFGSSSVTPQNWVMFHPAISQNVYQWMLRQGDTVNDLHGTVNIPPTVTTTGNKAITLPTNSVNLVGSATGNGGASIVSVLWTQVSGPNTAGIINGSSTVVTVNNLIQGTYVFKFTGTDNNGLFSSANSSVVVSGAGTSPTANAGGTYIIDQSNAYDVFLNGVATGSNLKYQWTFPCFCYTGNDNSSPTSATTGDPRVAKIVSPNILNPQIIEMKLNEGDSVHRYKFVLTVTDSVTGLFATDTAFVIYRYWTRFPPQNVDGTAGYHLCTNADHNSMGCAIGVDAIVAGANTDLIRGLYTSYQMLPNFADTFHVAAGAKIYIQGGDYFKVHMEWDTVGSVLGPLGDTTKAQIVITNYNGQVRCQDGFYFANIRNVKITGKYDSAKHTGDIRYQGPTVNGYAYSDTTYGLLSNNYYRSVSGHGFQLEGISTQWPEIEYYSGMRGNFDALILKAELPSNYTTQIFWHRLKLHDVNAYAAHGENIYIGSANNPATRLIDCHIWNCRSRMGGNKGIKTVCLYSRDTVERNSAFCNSIDWPSPFSTDVSNGTEVEFINTGNVITHNMVDGYGANGINLLTYKYVYPLPVGTNAIRANCYYHGVFNYASVFIQVDSPFTALVDSNYWGGRQFLASKAYKPGSYGTNTTYQVDVTTNSGVPPQATKNTYTVTNTIFDSTAYNLYTTGSALFTGSANNTLIGAIPAPLFNNSGFSPTQFPIQWVDTVFKMWGDEYTQDTTVVRQGTPMVYDLGMTVKWFDKYYISKISNNVGHCPTGATDTYWTLITFSNGGTTDPGDISLMTTDPYYLKGIGLFPLTLPYNPGPFLYFPNGSVIHP